MYVKVGDDVNFTGSYATYASNAAPVTFGAALGTGNSTHAAVLTITGNGSSPYNAYVGTSNPGSHAGSSSITVSTNAPGMYVPGLLNSIASGNATKGAVAINGFSRTDPEIVAVALKVNDGTVHEPTAQEINDIVADLNLSANQNLPAGWSPVLVEQFGNLTPANPSLQVSNPAAYTLLNHTNSVDGGGNLDLAFVFTPNSVANPQTFGLDFTNETVDSITSVQVTDVAVVPEPASLSLLVLGSLPLLGRRRRKA